MDQSILENNLKCAFCLKLLNVSPIYCIEHDEQIQGMCGRCVLDTDIFQGTRLRQYMYEDLAKLMTYPCSNKKYGCKKILRWDEVEAHENVCPFEWINCPLLSLNVSQTCSWSSSIKSLDEHIQICHSDSILNPPHFNWTDLQKDTVFFVKVKAKFVTMFIKFNKNAKCYCLLMINGSDADSQCYRYRLDFIDKDDNLISLCRNRLEPIGEILANMSDMKKMLEIDFSALKSLLNNSEKISCRINVFKKPQEELKLNKGDQDCTLSTSPQANNDKEVPSSDKKILKELVCKACNRLIVPPIFITTIGHSICGDCKKENKPNFPCTGTRNFTLEKLTTKLQYPCHNKKLGCQFTAVADQIRNHEKFCKYDECSCILGSSRCQWKGSKCHMYKHLISAHSNFVINANNIYTHDIRDTLVSYRVMHLNGEFFRLGIRNLNENNDVTTQFSVQHLGTTEENPRFRYKLEITDKSPKNLHMAYTNFCEPITKDRKKAHEKALSIPVTMNKTSIFESNNCFYKIYVTKL